MSLSFIMNLWYAAPTQVTHDKILLIQGPCGIKGIYCLHRIVIYLAANTSYFRIWYRFYRALCQNIYEPASFVLPKLAGKLSSAVQISIPNN